jgi:hypothetical protein
MEDTSGRPRRRLIVLAITVAALAASVALAGLLIPREDEGIRGRQPSCGTVVNGAQYDATPTDCLWRAYSSSQPAQATMVNTTVEGDHITYVVNVLTDGVHVSIDSNDKFGPRGTFAYTCRGMTHKPSTNGSGRPYLVATGCTGPSGFVDDAGSITIP